MIWTFLGNIEVIETKSALTNLALMDRSESSLLFPFRMQPRITRPVLESGPWNTLVFRDIFYASPWEFKQLYTGRRGSTRLDRVGAKQIEKISSGALRFSLAVLGTRTGEDARSD